MATNARVMAPIDALIYLVRGKRVILDADMARLYGVPTKRFNEQVRRNRDRFSLSAQGTEGNENSGNRSQFATGSARRRSRAYRPWAFTEHGALMAANVLNSPRAVRMSVEVVRAFVRLREMVASHKELSRRLDELETKYDRQFKVVFDAIRGLMAAPEPQTRRRIGFIVDD